MAAAVRLCDGKVLLSVSSGCNQRPEAVLGKCEYVIHFSIFKINQFTASIKHWKRPNVEINRQMYSLSTLDKKRLCLKVCH